MLDLTWGWSTISALNWHFSATSALYWQRGPARIDQISSPRQYRSFGTRRLPRTGGLVPRILPKTALWYPDRRETPGRRFAREEFRVPNLESCPEAGTKPPNLALEGTKPRDLATKTLGIPNLPTWPSQAPSLPTRLSQDNSAVKCNNHYSAEKRRNGIIVRAIAEPQSPIFSSYGITRLSLG